MTTKRLGLIMNGVTGRMGLNQHLIRSIVAIREQGGVLLSNGDRIMPDPILVGRDAEKVGALAKRYGIERHTTDLDRALADKDDTVFFDAATTQARPSLLTKAINATSGDDGWSALGLVGQHLSRAHADFDPRTFGHQKLSSLVDEQPYLETRAEGSQRQVRLRTRARKTAPASRSAKKATTTKTTSGRSAASTD